MAEYCKNTNVLQYVNTALLTLICGFSMIIFVTIHNVKNEQEQVAKELIRLKTVQDMNVSNFNRLDTRVSALEIFSVQLMKDWVESNYVRKSQK